MFGVYFSGANKLLSMFWDMSRECTYHKTMNLLKTRIAIFKQKFTPASGKVNLHGQLCQHKKTCVTPQTKPCHSQKHGQHSMIIISNMISTSFILVHTIFKFTNHEWPYVNNNSRHCLNVSNSAIIGDQHDHILSKGCLYVLQIETGPQLIP